LAVTNYRKLFDLTGKTAVAPGAASGIGKSSAMAAGPPLPPTGLTQLAK
jgi:hypothetical protein